MPVITSPTVTFNSITMLIYQLGYSVDNSSSDYIITNQQFFCLPAMKTSSSFFPTRTNIKSQQQHREHVARLIHPQERASTSSKPDTAPANIFRDESNPAYREQPQNPQFRPVGGTNWFKKMLQHSKEHPHQYKKGSKRSYKDNSFRNIAISSGSRFRKDKYDHEEGQETLPLKSINENQKERPPVVMVDEFFRSHASYEPSVSASKLRNCTEACKSTVKSTVKSELKSRPKTSKAYKGTERLEKQCKDYHDKVALLNEINYSKPLVERYGQRYFEFNLRNRYEQDLRPQPYVYLLSEKKFSDTKTISKIRNQRPDIRERQMMLLRGRKVGGQPDDI